MKSPPLKLQKENTIRTAGEPTENVAISVIIWRNLAESVCLPCFGIARIANSLSERLVGWWWGGIRARGRRSLGDEQIRFARLRLLSNLLTGKHTHDQSHARQLNSCSEFVWVFARRSNLAAVWKKKILSILQLGYLQEVCSGNRSAKIFARTSSKTRATLKFQYFPIIWIFF